MRMCESDGPGVPRSWAVFPGPAWDRRPAEKLARRGVGRANCPHKDAYCVLCTVHAIAGVGHSSLQRTWPSHLQALGALGLHNFTRLHNSLTLWLHSFPCKCKHG